MEENPIILLGAGGHARVLLDTLLKANKNVIGILDAQAAVDKKIFNVPVLGTDDYLENFPPNSVQLVNGIGSIGDTNLRAEIYTRFIQRGYEFTNIIHPTAVLGREVTLGKGVQVMAGAVIQTGCSVGDNVIINTQASIDHDCLIGSHTHIAPGAVLSGEVKIGDGSHIGTGAVIIQGVHIGANALVGAGAVVLQDVLDGMKVVGVPAKEIRHA